jgi:hypothetical protein
MEEFWQIALAIANLWANTRYKLKGIQETYEKQFHL